MRVLGVDPGLTRCGVGIIESNSSRKVSLVFVDTVHTSPNDELQDRIRLVGEALASTIERFKPDAIALERVFAQQNLPSVMGVAQVSGVLLFLAAQANVPVRMHTPSEVKAAVTGSGRANKGQMGVAVAKILGLDEIPKPADSADALAVAIASAWRSGIQVDGVSSQTPAQQAWARAERASRTKK